MLISKSGQACSIFIIALFAFIRDASSVSLPKCEAPPYGGQASIKTIGSELAWPYHLTMMVNESDNGRIAYCLTRSGMTKSGLSFGVSQMDLRTNPKAWAVFESILQNVGKVQEKLAFNDGDINLMKSSLAGDTAPRAIDLLNENNPRIDTLLLRANESLKNNLSRTIIDALHTEHVKQVVGFIANTQRDILASTVSGSKLLATSNAAKLLIMDYKNLFGSIDEKLKPFLMSGEVTMTKGAMKMGGSSIAVSDIVIFILNTKQGSGCKANERAELLRRIGNVITIALKNEDKTAWTPQDRDFFSKTLPSILDDPCVSRNKVDLSHVRKLTRNLTLTGEQKENFL